MNTKKLWWLLPLAFLGACSNGANHEKYSAENAVADSAALPLNSPERKIIRTADFKCKVDNVLTAVSSLERAVTAAGGIVQDSRLDNSTEQSKTVYYKPDSIKQYNTYTTTATLTLRVPVGELDSIIHSIPNVVSFIDARTLQQTDITANYAANQMSMNTGTQVYTPKQAVQLAKKSEDLVAVQQYEDAKAADLISKKTNQMRMMDEVSYSTLTLSLSQTPRVYVQVAANTDYITAVPFFTQTGAALRNGWEVMESLLMALLSIWPLLLVGAGVFVWFKKVRRRPMVVKEV